MEGMQMGQVSQDQPSGRKSRWLWVLLAVIILAVVVGSTAVYFVTQWKRSILYYYVVAGGTTAYIVGSTQMPGYHDYTVQKQQHYVEYSDKYPYWDVLTVEYPVLAGIDDAAAGQIERINEELYEMAMDRVNYWHLTPNDEVKRLQEEYSIFSSDVNCDVTYHSQYLMSVDFEEIYAPINPVWYVYTTKRALTVDLMSGENYALKDVLRLDEDFVTLWVDKFNEQMEEEMIGSEDVAVFIDWLNGEDEELQEFYDFVPFFYVTGEKDFVVGVSLDPKVAAISYNEPSNSTFYTELTAEEIAPYRTESLFWDRYDKSNSTGEVLECEEKNDNIWLGDQGSVWDYWDER